MRTFEPPHPDLVGAGTRVWREIRRDRQGRRFETWRDWDEHAAAIIQRALEAAYERGRYL